MTMSELDLTHGLLLLTQESEGNSAELPVNIDYEKFNFQWRMAHSILSRIDDLLGTPNLLTYTREFFEDIYIHI